MARTTNNPFGIPNNKVDTAKNFYQGAFFQENLKNWNEKYGMSFKQFSEQNQEIKQTTGAFSKIINAVFGVLMVPINAIEGFVSGEIKGIRETIEGQKTLAQFGTDVWLPTEALKNTYSYVKAGFGNSPNNGFRFWEDVSGAYTQMDKLSPTLKFFIGLGTDVLTMMALPAMIPEEVAVKVAQLGRTVNKAFMDNLNNVEMPLVSGAAKRMATVLGGYDTATASDYPLINKAFSLLWETKNFKEDLFGFQRTMKAKTLAELSTSTGMASASKRAATAFNEKARGDFNAVVKNFAKDIPNDDELETLAVAKSNTDLHWSDDNIKFTNKEWDAITTKSIRSLSSNEKQNIIRKIHANLSWQRIIEIEKGSDYMGNFNDFLLPKLETTFNNNAGDKKNLILYTKNSQDEKALGLKNMIESLTNENTNIHDWNATNDSQVLSVSKGQVRKMRRIADDITVNGPDINNFVIQSKNAIFVSVDRLQDILIDTFKMMKNLEADLRLTDINYDNIIKERTNITNNLESLLNLTDEKLTTPNIVDNRLLFTQLITKLQDPNAILTKEEQTFLKRKFMHRELGQSVRLKNPKFQQFLNDNVLDMEEVKTGFLKGEYTNQLARKSVQMRIKLNQINRNVKTFQRNAKTVESLEKDNKALLIERKSLEKQQEDSNTLIVKKNKNDSQIRILLERNEKHTKYLSDVETSSNTQRYETRLKAWEDNNVRIKELNQENNTLNQEIKEKNKIAKAIKKNTVKSEKNRATMDLLNKRNVAFAKDLQDIKDISTFFNEATERMNDILEFYYLNKLTKDTIIDMPTFERNYVSQTSWLQGNKRLWQESIHSMTNNMGEDERLNAEHLKSSTYLNHQLLLSGKTWLKGENDFKDVNEVFYNTTKKIITPERKMIGDLYDKEIAFGFNRASAEELVNGGWDINLDQNLMRVLGMQERQLRATSAFLSAAENGEFIAITHDSPLKAVASGKVRSRATLNKRVISKAQFREFHLAAREVMAQTEKDKWDLMYENLTKPKIESIDFKESLKKIDALPLDDEKRAAAIKDIQQKALKKDRSGNLIDDKRSFLVDSHLWDVVEDAMGVNDSKEGNLLARILRKLLNFWKQWSVLNPGFFFRIFTGNAINFSVVGGVRNLGTVLKNWTKVLGHMHRFQLFIADVGHRVIDDIIKTGGSDTSDNFSEQLLRLATTEKEKESIMYINKMYKSNLINFGGTSRTNTAENYLQFGLNKRLSESKIKHPLTTLMNWGHRGVSYIDDGFKMAVFQTYKDNVKLRHSVLSGLGKKMSRDGLSEDQVCSLLTKRTNFDYSELSKKEFGIVRNIIPFYTWMKNNLTLWWKAIKTPGISNVVNDIMNYPFNTDLYKYESKGDLENHYLPIHLFGKTISLKFHLPFDDIKTIFSADAVSRLNPAISMLFNAFTGQDLASGYQTTMLGEIVPTDFRNALNDGLYALGWNKPFHKLFGYDTKSPAASNSIFKVEDAQAQYEKNIEEYNYQIRSTYDTLTKYAYDRENTLLKRELTEPKLTSPRKITDKNRFE